ncbi:hypothetical protein FBU30_003358 [Linnemannia zychae]|nr:hypothetical protein FBU30_003358 [Linnemannia zychae]
MPFRQPTGVPASGLRGNSTGTTSSSKSPPLISNTSSSSIPARKKVDPENLCHVCNQWVRSAEDSMDVFTKSWRPFSIPVISSVVFIHDIMEHCERYHSLFVQFAARGIEVQAIDLPGFGETGARGDAYGITGGYNVLLLEIDRAIDRVVEAHPNKPVFLMGHGMGGALVLNYVCGLGRRIPLLAGVISSSPYLKPTITGAGTRFPGTYNQLGKWYPNIAIRFRVIATELTNDLVEQERYQNDGLIRDTVSLQCLGDMIYQGQKLLKKRWKHFPVPLPILLLHGTDDPICSYQATYTLNKQLLKLQPHSFLFKSWKGSMHDRKKKKNTHWDLDAHSVRSEFTTWIRNNSKRFEKPPLEPNMVHQDTIRSVRSNSSSSSSKNSMTNKKDNKKNKLSKEDNKLAKKDKDNTMKSKDHMDQVEAYTNKESKKTPFNPANAEPEAIQDLEGLRKQLEFSKQKATEKCREYNLEPSGIEKQQEGTGSESITTGPTLEDAGLTEQQQKTSVPIIVTETTSLSISAISLQQQQSPSLSSSQDPISSESGQQGPASVLLSPIVERQSEIEKNLEAVALTLSRHSSLSNKSFSTSDPAISTSDPIISTPDAALSTSSAIINNSKLITDLPTSSSSITASDIPPESPAMREQDKIVATLSPLESSRETSADTTVQQQPSSLATTTQIISSTISITPTTASTIDLTVSDTELAQDIVIQNDEIISQATAQDAREILTPIHEIIIENDRLISQAPEQNSEEILMPVHETFDLDQTKVHT